MVFPLTFELWDLPRCTLGQALVTGIAGQRHGNTTAAQQETNLLAAGVLLGETGRGKRPVILIFIQQHDDESSSSS